MFCDKTPDAYKIESHLHDTVLGINDVITTDELNLSGVVARTGSTSSTTSQRIEVTGILNGERVHQTLVLNGLDRYHLSTMETKMAASIHN